MTREELIEEVAEKLFQGAYGEDVKHLYFPRAYYGKLAETAINTIFDALKEPTNEMCFAGGEYVLSVGSIDCMHVDDRPEFGMKGRETGSYELFQAMLSASPLAPEE